MRIFDNPLSKYLTSLQNSFLNAWTYFQLFTKIQWCSREAVTEGVMSKKLFLKIHKFYRKTPVHESLFNNVTS